MNGEQALDMIKVDCIPKGHKGVPRKPRYSLIFMDCNMPFMDGFECTAKIRSFFYVDCGLGVRNQPIISAITGHVEPRFIKKCFDHGMNQVLSKPVEQQALLYACVEGGLTTEEKVKSYQEAKEKMTSKLTKFFF